MDAALDRITTCFAAGAFRERRVLVSGASSGIGLEIARGFAALGAEVLATGSSAAKLDAARGDEANRGIVFERLDVRDGEAVGALIGGQTRLDVLVNAAGVARPGAEYEDAVFLDTMDVNLHAAMRSAMAAYPLLKESRGSIVNIASMLSFLADAEVPAYCASKTGLLGLTRALAHRFGGDGIRVNAVAPGYHKTDMTRPLWSQPRNHDAIAEQTALKHWGMAADLVGAALFLASPAASYITGICLPVDGGYSTKAPTG